MPRPTIIVRVDVDGTVSWRYAFDPASETWVGICDALNLNAVGDTYAELVEGMNDAVRGLLQDLLEDGDLADFMRARGWRMVGPSPAAQQRVRFDLPFDTLRSNVAELATAGA